MVSKVNSQIEKKSHGRLFAVIHLANKQWKITPEDVLVVDGYWPPNVGDSIRLEKVRGVFHSHKLLLANNLTIEFSLIRSSWSDLLTLPWLVCHYFALI